MVSCSVSWLVGHSVGCSVGWLFGWLVVRSVGWLVGGLFGWLFVRLVGWLVVCSVGWSVGRSVGRLVGWLAAGLPCTLNHGSPTRPHAARGHICTLSMYHQNCTTSRAVRYTTYLYFFICGPRTSPQYRVWRPMTISVCHRLLDLRTLTEQPIVHSICLVRQEFC